LSLLPGQKFDRYAIDALLGEGGMGRVYRAYDPRLQRHVALKVLRFRGGEGGHDAVAGALREARAAAAIAHPHATQVFDAAEIDGVAFIVMEYVPGTPMRRIIGDADVPLATRIRWLLDVAGALAAAHQVGVVHRDVKPENLLVRDDGLVKVLDFGVARRTRPSASIYDTSPGVEMITANEGSLVGTPAYMAPEQMRGEDIDGRADQFGWGVLAYELLTGHLPWTTAKDFVGYLAAVMTETPEPPSRRAPEIPAAVDAVLLRTLAKSRDDRFPSMLAAATALSPFAAPSIAMMRVDRHSQPLIELEATEPTMNAPIARPIPAPPPSHPAALSHPTPPSPQAVTLASGREIAAPPAPATIPSPALAPAPSSAFHAPRFDAPVDLDGHLALLPPDATCKGMFFLDLLRLGATVAPAEDILATAGIPSRRYVAFRDYPMADNMLLSVAVALAVHSGLPVGEGLRRIGRTALDVVLGSQVGRSLLGVFDRDVEALLAHGPKAFKLLLSFGDVKCEKVGPRRFVLHARRFPAFLETYQVGIIEGMLRHCKTRGQITIQVQDLANATMMIELA
jgi:uncharacterized protein (TIGR02265 family)